MAGREWASGLAEKLRGCLRPAFQIIQRTSPEPGHRSSGQEVSVAALREKLSPLGSPANTVLEVIIRQVPVPFHPVTAKQYNRYFPVGRAGQPSIQDAEDQEQSLRSGNLQSRSWKFFRANVKPVKRFERIQKDIEIIGRHNGFNEQMHGF